MKHRHSALILGVLLGTAATAILVELVDWQGGELTALVTMLASVALAVFAWETNRATNDARAVESARLSAARKREEARHENEAKDAASRLYFHLRRGGFLTLPDPVSALPPEVFEAVDHLSLLTARTLDPVRRELVSAIEHFRAATIHGEELNRLLQSEEYADIVFRDFDAAGYWRRFLGALASTLPEGIDPFSWEPKDLTQEFLDAATRNQQADAPHDPQDDAP